MRLSARLGPVVVAFSVAVAGCGAGDEQGSVGGGEPPPPPRADPAAGAPEYLGAVRQHVVLFDARGRVVRSLGGWVESLPAACPGGRLLAFTRSWSGRVVVTTLRGRRVWSARFPGSSAVDRAACLDAGGRRVAFVTDSITSRAKTLRLATRGRRRARAVRRFHGEAPLVAADRVWVTDAHGIRTLETATGRELERIAAPPHVHRLLLSPDGAHLAMVGTDDDVEDVLHVADLRTGATTEVASPGRDFVGWLAPGRLVMTAAGRRIVEIDPELRERTIAEGGWSHGVRIDRDRVIAIRDGELIAFDPETGRRTRIGTVPRGAYALERLP